jgi:hypothetical protein
VPFNKAVKTNSFKQENIDDYGRYVNNLRPEIEQNHAYLNQYYVPENYDERELAAIESYTGGTYVDINNKLSSLPTGIPADQIQADYLDDQLPSIIEALDSAVNKVPAPRDFLTYVSLNQNYNPMDFNPGQTFRFKGFRSTSIDPGVALNFANGANQGQTVMLQILVKKGTRGMYVDEYSASPGEAEFLLPRGSAVKITSGPSKLVGSNKYSNEINHPVVFFNANKMYIQEAIKNIAEKKLDEMKQNVCAALSEKAMGKLEEKKIAMAQEYFAKKKSEKED